MPPPSPPPPLKVNQTVRLLLTKHEQQTYKRTHIICQIDEINSSHTHFQLLSEWGVIDEWFPRDRVVAAPENFFNPVKTAALTMLDLEKALMQDGIYGFRNGTHSCVCSTKCRSRYCPCYRARKDCDDECHAHHFSGFSETCANHRRCGH